MERNEVLFKNTVEKGDGVTIVFNAMVEHDSPIDSFEDAKIICIEIDNGKLKWFCAEVYATYYNVQTGKTIKGEAEYLGGCCYSSFEAFTDDSYFEDMEQSALRSLAELRKQLTVKMFLGENASELEYALAKYKGTLAEFLKENANRIGNFIDKNFDSEAEKQAYLEGIEDAFGWDGYTLID